jgi:hypothetical protein
MRTRDAVVACNGTSSGAQSQSREADSSADGFCAGRRWDGDSERGQLARRLDLCDYVSNTKSGIYTAHSYFLHIVPMSFPVALKPNSSRGFLSAVRLHMQVPALHLPSMPRYSLFALPPVLLSFVGLYYLAQWYAASDPF